MNTILHCLHRYVFFCFSILLLFLGSCKIYVTRRLSLNCCRILVYRDYFYPAIHLHPPSIYFLWDFLCILRTPESVDSIAQPATIAARPWNNSATRLQNPSAPRRGLAYRRTKFGEPWESASCAWIPWRIARWSVEFSECRDSRTSGTNRLQNWGSSGEQDGPESYRGGIIYCRPKCKSWGFSTKNRNTDNPAWISLDGWWKGLESERSTNFCSLYSW